jgi:hypothetical protein
MTSNTTKKWFNNVRNNAPSSPRQSGCSRLPKAAKRHAITRTEKLFKLRRFERVSQTGTRHFVNKIQFRCLMFFCSLGPLVLVQSLVCVCDDDLTTGGGSHLFVVSSHFFR